MNTKEVNVYDVLLPDTPENRQLAFLRDRMSGCLRRVARDSSETKLVLVASIADKEFDGVLARLLPDPA